MPTNSPGSVGIPGHGSEPLCDSSSTSWRDDVRAANAGQPVDVVFDPVGGDMTETAFRTLGWGGRLLVIGFAGGSIAKLAANLPLLKGAALVGVDVRQFGEREPELASADLQSLFDLYEKGLLAPKIGRVFPIDDFARAMLTCSQTIGRTVLSMRSGWKG